MWTEGLQAVRIPILEVADDPGSGAPVEAVVGWKPGYALNGPRAAIDLIAAAAPYRVEPEAPLCLFAGDERDADGRWTLTAFLLFSDEPEARRVLAGLWVDEPDPEPDSET